MEIGVDRPWHIFLLVGTVEGKIIFKSPSREQKYPPGEKENHRLKSELEGGMLVPWRVSSFVINHECR